MNSVTNGAASPHPWTDLPSQFQTTLLKANKAGETDGQLKGFTAIGPNTGLTTFGIKAAGSNNAILVTITNGSAQMTSGDAKDALFVLVALPEQWKQFFKPTPAPPYQSYWGMLTLSATEGGVEMQGDWNAFAQWSHVWRRVLELLHDAQNGPTPTDEEPERETDHIVGRYMYITSPGWGKCKIFYEQSGEGGQDILFLHTAGSDSRQYHGVMNDDRMRQKCRMTAFDLPAHGRSFPSEGYYAGLHTNTEDAYVGCISALVKKLCLNKPIICGASMASQACLAIATRADEVGAGGIIPVQASEHLNMERNGFDRSPYVNSSLFNPEFVYGLTSPNAPLVNRQLIWHTYSAQSFGIFSGDLNFYFGGWDGRGRMSSINTKKCPVYILTGEYDWANPPALSQATCDKIPGGMHTVMKGLGHFPATENPGLFVGYLLVAIDHVQKTRA